MGKSNLDLDSAIRHCLEVADGHTEQGRCPECAMEHRQLAEWLRDYKRLKERESCEDCVSRQAVFDALEKVAGLFPWRVPGKLDTYDSYNGTWNDAIGRAEMEIEGLPPVNPQKTGHWKSFTHSAYHGIDDDREPIWREVKVYHCNLCNRRTVIKENYCPNCGAKMEEEE